MEKTDLVEQSPTGATIGRVGKIEPPTRTISDVVEDAGYLRNQTKLLVDDSRDLHQSVDGLHAEALETELEALTNQRAKEELTVLLEELSSLGFSWRSIARVAQVSVPALRKWRLGGQAIGENRKRVAMAVAVCAMVREKYLIDDVAGWLEVPLHTGAPVTGLDLIANDRFDLVLRSARDLGEDPGQILDEFEPGWRDRYASLVETFVAPDGLPGIRFIE